MAKQPKIKAQLRTQIGGRASRKLGRAGLVPANVYAKGEQNLNLQLDKREITTVLAHATSEHILVDLEIADGSGTSNRLALIQEVQHHPLDGPDVLGGEPPVIATHVRRQVDDGVALHSAGVVDVRVGVAEGEGTRRREHRLSAVQARVTRARDGAPASLPAVDEQDVIQLIDRFEAQDRCRVAMLLEDDGGKERRLEAVGAVVRDDAAERAERRTHRLVVVRHRVQVRLHTLRRIQARDEPPFSRCENVARRRFTGAVRLVVSSGHRLAVAVRSASSWSAVQSFPE